MEDSGNSLVNACTCILKSDQHLISPYCNMQELLSMNKKEMPILLLWATRGACNRNLQVVITHA